MIPVEEHPNTKEPRVVDLDLDAILQRSEVLDPAHSVSYMAWAEDVYASARDVRVLVEEIRALRRERDALLHCCMEFEGRIAVEDLPYNASVTFHEILRGAAVSFPKDTSDG